VAEPVLGYPGGGPAMVDHGGVADAPEHDLDLSRARRIHVVGIGGPGINPVASVLAAMGHRVSGSDLKESAGLDRLRAHGLEIYVGHRSEHVADAEVVCRAGAVPDHNIEVRTAVQRGLPVLGRADLLEGICRRRSTLAVAGTHGKTTTTAMLALAMVEAGLQPSYLVGGDINDIGSGAVWDEDGEWFVVEATTCDGTFLRLGASAVVVTNIEIDRLDDQACPEDLADDYTRVSAGARRLRLFCADDPGAATVAARVDATTYGTAATSDWRVVDVAGLGVGSRFRVVAPDGDEHLVYLPVPGLHNVRNATAAIAATVSLGGDPEAAVAALGRFAGVARRFEFRGDAAGVTVVDDYAHLPSEVRASVEAAAGVAGGRVVAVFQAHRYGPVQWFWEDFGGAFDGADLVVIAEPHPGPQETPPPGVSGMLLIRGVLEHRPRADVAYVPHRAALRSYLLARLRPGDMCVIMQAGGALTDLPDDLLAALAARQERAGAA
jgi:UDP-N-acetylmuramate--alanine ligase